MKKILLIAPACYPVDGAEAIVNMKLLQTLQQSGMFDIDVITKKRQYDNYPSAKLESYGIKESKVHIIEVPNKINFRTIVETTMCFVKFGATMKGAHWAYEALPEVKKLVHENRYNYVITKNAPSFLLGYYLKKKYNLKWVASWNDPYPREKYPAPYGKGWNYSTWWLSREIERMRMADMHLFPSERLKRWMQHYLKVPESITRIVPHVLIPQKKERPTQYDTLMMIHSGSLKSPRNPENLFKALAQVIHIKPEAKIELHILGNVTGESINLIKELRLEKYVHVLGMVPYHESLDLLSKYHLAIIVEANCEEGIFLPTKVADFMSVNIPIFSISPKIGVLHDLYEKGQISYFASVNNVKEIAEGITVAYEDFMSGKVRESKRVNEYSSENILNAYLSF